MMFARLYWPGPPMTNILFFITSMLVCCSSDPPENEVLMLDRSSVILGTTPIPLLLRRSHTGVLILRSYVVSTVRQLGRISEIYLQRRLILVNVGVTVPCTVFLPPLSLYDAHDDFPPCSISSFLPPSTTLRKYQRTALATATEELGAIYCSIVSFANTDEHTDEDIQEIVQSLIAVRAKLKRSLMLKQNIVFEVRQRNLGGEFNKLLIFLHSSH